MSGMSSSLGNRIQCLLCEGKNHDAGSCSLSHIHSHLGYKKYTCDSCDFSCYAEDDALFHKFKLSHVVSLNRSEYKEALSNLIYLHCLHAAEFGIAAVVSNGILYSTSPTAGSGATSKEYQEVQQKTDKKGKEKHERREGGESGAVTKERSRLASRSSESEKDVAQKQKDKVSRSVVDKAGKEKKQRLVLSPPFEKSARSDDLGEGKALDLQSEDRRKGDSHRCLAGDGEQPGPSKRVRTVSAVDERNALLKSSDPDTLPCRKCKQEVGSSYIERRQHVMTVHLKAEERIKEEVSSAEMRECFPRCAVFSDEQCIECGKVVKSDHGRRNHISTQHFKRTIECVVPGCGLYEATPSDLKKHIESIHGIPLSSAVSGDVFRLFSCAKKEFDAAIAIKMLHYFPFELRRSASGLLTDLASARGIPSTSISERFTTVQSAFREELSLRSRSHARQPRTPSPSSSDSSVDSLQRILKKRRGSSAEGKKNSSSAQNVIAPVDQVDVVSVKSSAVDSNLFDSVGTVGSYALTKKPPILPTPTGPQTCKPSTSESEAGRRPFEERNAATLSSPVNSSFTSPRSSEFCSSGNRNCLVETPRRIQSTHAQEPSHLISGPEQYGFAFRGNSSQLQRVPGTVLNEGFIRNEPSTLINDQNRSLPSSSNLGSAFHNESSLHVPPVPSTGNPQKTFFGDAGQNGLEKETVRNAQQNLPDPKGGAQSLQKARPEQNVRNPQKGARQNQPHSKHHQQNPAQQRRSHSISRGQFQERSRRRGRSRGRPNPNPQNNADASQNVELNSFGSFAHQPPQHLGQFSPTIGVKQESNAPSNSTQHFEINSTDGTLKTGPLGFNTANVNDNVPFATARLYAARSRKKNPRGTAPKKRPVQEKPSVVTVVRPGQWKGKRKRFNSGGSNGGKREVQVKIELCEEVSGGSSSGVKKEPIFP